MSATSTTSSAISSCCARREPGELGQRAQSSRRHGRRPAAQLVLERESGLERDLREAQPEAVAGIAGTPAFDHARDFGLGVEPVVAAGRLEGDEDFVANLGAERTRTRSPSRRNSSASTAWQVVRTARRRMRRVDGMKGELRVRWVDVGHELTLCAAEVKKSAHGRFLDASAGPVEASTHGQASKHESEHDLAPGELRRAAAAASHRARASQGEDRPPRAPRDTARLGGSLWAQRVGPSVPKPISSKI